MFFDPADKLLGLKIPLFLACWVIFVFSYKSFNLKFPRELIYFALFFLTIPIISISYYLIFDGSFPYGGFSLFKSFLFVSFIFILYRKKIDLIPSISRILTVLSFLIISLYIIVLVFPFLFISIFDFGEQTGIFLIGQRVYSSNLKLWSIYFVSSPMIIIAIAYYFDKAFKSRKIKYYLILIINIFAMFIAGTRNNMIMSIALPLILYFIYSKNKKFALITLFSIVTLGSIYLIEIIGDLFNPYEESNNVKLNFLSDYIEIFSNPQTLLFGQGLGAYENFNSIGRFYFTSELTYFEIFRYFGIFLGSVIIYFMFFPVIYSYYNRYKVNNKHIVIAYFLYLIMTFSNPLFFSSLGMLFFAIIVTKFSFTKKYLNINDYLFNYSYLQSRFKTIKSIGR